MDAYAANTDLLGMSLTDLRTGAPVAGARVLLEGPGVNEEVVQILAAAQVHSPDELVRMPLEQLASATGIDMSDLAKLRQRAITYLAAVEAAN